MAIQWYPGHMTSARKKAAETMASIDVVIEVVDARLPEASTNPMVRELRLHRQRPCLKVLNKADLADPSVTPAWIEYYNRQDGVRALDRLRLRGESYFFCFSIILCSVDSASFSPPSLSIRPEATASLP